MNVISSASLIKRLQHLLVGLLPLLSLMSCGGGGGSDGSPNQQSDSTLEGLAECLPQAGYAVVCGTVFATDGITPLVNAEITLSISEARLVNRSIVAFSEATDLNKCITDYSGVFACMLPAGIYGDIELVVSLSGFDDSTISATALLDETVDLSQVSLTGNSNSRWVVIPGAYDGVQVLLAQLKGCTLNDEYGNTFDVTTTSANHARWSQDCQNKGLIVLDDLDMIPGLDVMTFLKSEEFTDNDALFVNCPANYGYDSEINQVLQDFVAAGKHIYFSDQSDAWMTAAFPEKISIAGGLTSIGTLSVTTTHAGLSSVVGNNLEITFDLPMWRVIDSINTGVTTFLEADVSSISDYSGVHPITVGWRDSSAGEGCIFYTSYHIEGASIGSDQELAMKYLVQNMDTACNY
ncbi:MAG: hypothetical protein PVI97_14070 [Candidatus Thiodiazotropha sp.]|jgi:hypothetical protein